jgi:hypothetical protein
MSFDSAAASSPSLLNGNISPSGMCPWGRKREHAVVSDSAAGKLFLLNTTSGFAADWAGSEGRDDAGSADGPATSATFDRPNGTRHKPGYLGCFLASCCVFLTVGCVLLSSVLQYRSRPITTMLPCTIRYATLRRPIEVRPTEKVETLIKWLFLDRLLRYSDRWMRTNLLYVMVPLTPHNYHATLG